MPRRTPIVTIVAAIALLAATAGMVAAIAAPDGAQANPPCYVDSAHILHCGDYAPSPIYSAAKYGYEDTHGGFHPTPVVDWLRTNPSTFKCYVHGEQHSGGNNIWYSTNGDDHHPGKWGYVPAVRVFTSPDPYPGVRACG